MGHFELTPSEFGYCGWRVKQDSKRVTADQSEYINGIQEENTTPNDSKTNLYEAFRRLLGKLSWVCGTRPCVTARVAIWAQTTAEDITEKVIKVQKETTISKKARRCWIPFHVRHLLSQAERCIDREEKRVFESKAVLMLKHARAQRKREHQVRRARKYGAAFAKPVKLPKISAIRNENENLIHQKEEAENHAKAYFAKNG